jgi:hypothetical protein
MGTPADSVTKRLLAEIERVPPSRRAPLLKIVHAYREALEEEAAEFDPAESLRRAVADVKAGRTYPIETLWDGIDA